MEDPLARESCMVLTQRRSRDGNLEPSHAGIDRPGSKQRTILSEPSEFYVIQIADWDWAFSFSTNRTGFLAGAYLDARHLNITGDLLRPKSLKVQSAKLTLLPDPGLQPEKWPARPPAEIAQLSVQGGILEASIHLPWDALSPLLVAMCAGHLKFAMLDAGRLHRRQASILGFRMARSYAETDLPPEQPQPRRR
ncbi:MAG TPA: hypothetical protein VGC09_00800 [Rhodopila sp.]